LSTEEAFIKVLQLHGIRNAFGIIGSAMMPVSDLFPKAGITFWDCAHETNAALICDGYTRAKLEELKQWLLASDERPFAAVVIKNGHIVLEVERRNSSITDSRRVASVMWLSMPRWSSAPNGEGHQRLAARGASVSVIPVRLARRSPALPALLESVILTTTARGSRRTASARRRRRASGR
jgi:hypothetical protein